MFPFEQKVKPGRMGQRAEPGLVKRRVPGLVKQRVPGLVKQRVKLGLVERRAKQKVQPRLLYRQLGRSCCEKLYLSTQHQWHLTEQNLEARE